MPQAFSSPLQLSCHPSAIVQAIEDGDMPVRRLVTHRIMGL